MSARSCGSSRRKLPGEPDVTASAEANFAGRLVQRLGTRSSMLDAATGHAFGGGELPHLIARHGRALISAGLKKGDRVLVGCTLSPASALVYLGAIYAGLVAVPVEDRTLTASLAKLVKQTGAKALWTQTEPRDGETDSILCLSGDLAGDTSTSVPPAAVGESDLAALMATSGSTGDPRFVNVSHGNLIANTEAIIRSQELSGNDRVMLILPLSYCFGTSLLHTHLYAGGDVVFDRRFMFPDKVLQSIAEYNCTTFAGVPTAYHVLLRRANLHGIALPSLRRFLQAGGRLAVDKIREMRAAFPMTKFYVMYGQTEATARISCMEPERWEEKAGSVGRPLDNLVIRIADEQGNPMPPGQTGRLWVKGPSISSGYWNNPMETQRTFHDGWLHTGDWAHEDAEGFLWIDGRQGSFLKMRGIRVSFTEAEEKVATMPGVYECAARAVEHPEAGEALVLFLVPEPGAKVGLEEVRRHLPAHWALDSIHLVSELPKTPAGKIAFSALPVQAKSFDAIVG
jgi:acyl-CoA synthetase (AMP-forming)/AMP-acid ligase II